MRVIKFSKLSIIISGMLLVLGCSDGTKERIIGKWQPHEKGESIEYFKDGTLTISSVGETVSGKWSILDDGRINYEASDGGKPVIFKYKVSFNGKDEMTTVGEGSQITTFTRVKQQNR